MGLPIQWTEILVKKTDSTGRCTEVTDKGRFEEKRLSKWIGGQKKKLVCPVVGRKVAVSAEITVNRDSTLYEY